MSPTTHNNGRITMTDHTRLAFVEPQSMNGDDSRRRSHILFIVENTTVPQDPRVWREALYAYSRGFRVSVIAPATDEDLPHETIEGIDIYRHPAWNQGSGKLAHLAEYGSALLYEFLLSVRIYRKHPFQIIHGANPPDHIFLIALLFRVLGVKFLFDHHDLAPELYLSKYKSRKGFFYHLLRYMERLSCKTAHAVISTNVSYKRHVIEHHRIDSRKVFVVRNDPEVAQEPTLGSCFAKERTRMVARLLYVGAINTQDGVDLLIRSLHILLHELKEPNFRCVVIGDGDDLQRVRELCTQLGMDTYINFIGFVRDKKVIIDHIRHADICLESAPLNEVNTKSTFIKIMEYMSQERPIVAFDLPETRYSTGGAALLVPPNDMPEFARAIMKLIRDPMLRAELGRHGRQRIVNKLNWEHSIKSLSRTYLYLLSPRASSSQVTTSR